jgi:CHASE2 domain-containing sensor protein
MPELARFTATLRVVMISISERLRSVAKGDRGDSPVSTAIIVAVLAVAALAVATAIAAIANGWLDLIPENGGGGGGGGGGGAP